MKLLLYNYVFASVLISAEVLTLIKDKSITCVLTDNSVNSTIYVINSDDLVKLERTIHEITTIYDDDWQWSKLSVNFRPVLDQRWTNFRPDTTGVRLENRFSLCFKQHSNILLHDRSYQHSTNIPLRHLHRPYSACQWRHYEIMNNLTHVSLVNSENNNVINVTKLEFYPVWLKFSPYNLNIKVHKYEFRYSTTTSTKPSYINITSMSCVSFYVSVDEGCYLDISVQPANSITKITGFNEKNKLKQWKKYEIRTDPKAINQTLSIDRGRDDNGNEGYWTIDGIYGCSSETVIYRANLNRSWTNQKCGELKQTNSSNELCDKASLGEKCKIKCLEVLGPKYPNCEEHRICLSENKCHCAWGFKGENCREECGEDSWGLDCLKNCTNCEKCDKKTGCQKCKAQYFGEQCVYKFPVVKKAPILEPSDDESIKILTNIEYGQDEEKAEHYYIQWRKLDSNDGFENYTDHQFPIAKNKESFSINISRNDSYQFRIILVSHNSSFQQDTIPKLTVYKKSLTAHVKHEETIVLNWIKHDPDETMYKITHRCQKSFCGHEAKEEYNMTSTTTIALTIKHSKICSIKLFIIKDGSDEFKEQTTVIPQNSTKEILPAELPGNVTFLKDQIVLELNKCHNFTGPLKYSIELICISEWCTNESTKIDPYHLLNYSTNITRDVKGLSPFTDYSIIVIAKRPGQHDKKQSYLTKSMPSAPQPVNTLHLYSSDEDTLFITWTEPFPPTGKIEAYNVTLRDHTSILVRTNCKMWPEFQCTNIPRGKKVSVYHVTVQAKNYEVAEWSESNFTINVENVTQAPQNLRIELSPQSTDEVILRWEYPLYTYGKIEKFRTVLHNSSGTENSTIPVFNEINYNKTIKIKYGIKYKFTAWAQNAHDGEKATIYFVISKPISKLSNQSFILWCKEKCHLVKPKLTTQENTSYNITIKQHNGTKTEHEAKESISPSEDKILCTENSPSCEIHSEFQDVANQSYFLQTDSEEIPIEFTATAESKIISKTNIIISAVVLSVILLFALLVGIFYYRYILKSKVSKATEMIEVKEKETLINTSNQTKIFFRPVDINEYAVYLFASLRDDTYQSVLTQQFQEVTTRKATDCIHGRLNKNLHKNHYKDILPYDDTRVILNDNENEDYINANYVDGYEHPKAYIVTQTPLTSTVHDFWSMICQENVKIIVMLCKLEEKECSKCQKYWPNDFSHFRFGSFLIECVSVTQNLNYIHRILEVKKNNKTHRVQHLQYLTWTIQGIPSCVKTFTAFVKELMGLRDEYPVVVHSEGGCGRTGMYILCDSVIRMSMKEKKVDFFQTLGKMRYQRDRVVSNVDQYIFCHFVLLEFYFPASNASNNFVLEIQQGMQETAIKRLVDRLDEAVTQPRNDKDKGFMISEDNSSSNNMSPLSVDCFNFPRRFIVTEEPSQNTLRSFWNLVLSHEVEIVVWLNGTNHNYKDYSRFWPKDTLHWFVNESTKLVFVCQDDSNDIYNTITVKIDTIGKSEEKFVKILYVKTWERTNATPSSTKDLIQIYDKIAPYNGQIVVTCYDGTTASGLFVVLVSLLEEINKHRSCDIFEAAYTAKQSCAEFLKNTEQIRFLYMAVLEYVREFNVYEVLS
ncbi:uncharacterized protein LOC135126279 isoform X2 [Zophobas morio]|uniref:uncharacterized protein LOC135126279 isoform X2 n=1 Tax=Zophobas morio TaxID=2755281 RepID=UPI003083BCA7